MQPERMNLPGAGLGCGPLGGIDAAMTNRSAREVLAGAWEAGLRYFDTAPWYGNTNSEHRVGEFLREMPRDQFVLTSKVGRIYQRPSRMIDFEKSAWRKRWPGGLPMIPHFDYTYDGIFRSFEDSIQRLGINRIDALAIHDLDERHHGTEERIQDGFRQLTEGRGFEALLELKRNHDIRAIGAGINLPGYIGRFLELFELDYFLVAMPYTLAAQDALDEEFPLCARHSAQVIVGAPFASGILATGAIEGARFAYGPASAQIMQRVSDIESVCVAFDVSLAAAALQFPLAHPVVSAVVFGADSAEQVRENVQAFNEVIPAGFWTRLKEEGLIAQHATVPD